MDKQRDGRLSAPALKARGWTETLIRTFLGDPDTLVPNPHYRAGAPMRLYAAARVEAVEQSEDWASLQDATRQRQAAAARAVQTKKAQLLATLARHPVTVPVRPLATLTQEACDHYNRRREERAWRHDAWDWTPATPDSDPAFLQRITVNYVRHVLSPYERRLERVWGKVGVREASQAIIAHVYEAIATAYPTLEAECRRQRVRKQSP